MMLPFQYKLSYYIGIDYRIGYDNMKAIRELISDTRINYKIDFYL